jgi:methyltransferase (TIGR00027 family)
MLEREPSRTAFAAATYRAAHQVLEQGRVFEDPFAVPILGVDPGVFLRNPEANEAQRGIRFFVAARSRIAEAALALGVTARGVGQLAVLGAGLDTFAYRNPFGGRLRVFEVDHPATQAWKRRRLAEAGIAVPGDLIYAPVDFERESLREQLAKAGLDPGLRTFFIWLGVVPYLTKAAIGSTLSQIAAHPRGAEVVFDYGEPREMIDPALRPQYEARAARVAAAGEPFLSYFAPAELHADLRARGIWTDRRSRYPGDPGAPVGRFGRSCGSPARRLRPSKRRSRPVCRHLYGCLAYFWGVGFLEAALRPTR